MMEMRGVICFDLFWLIRLLYLSTLLYLFTCLLVVSTIFSFATLPTPSTDQNLINLSTITILLPHHPITSPSLHLPRPHLPSFFFISQSPSHFIKLSLYRFMGLNTYIGRVMIQVLTPSFSSSDFSISLSPYLFIYLSPSPPFPISFILTPA